MMPRYTKVCCGPNNKWLRIPQAHKVQTRTADGETAHGLNGGINRGATGGMSKMLNCTTETNNRPPIRVDMLSHVTFNLSLSLSQLLGLMEETFCLFFPHVVVLPVCLKPNTKGRLHPLH